MGRGFDEQEAGTENRPDGNKRKWWAAVSAGNPSNPTLEKMDYPLRRSRMDENGRHGRSLGIPIHQGLDEQEQAGAGGHLNADSSHMADSRQAHGRRSADKRQTVGRGAQDQ